MKKMRKGISLVLALGMVLLLAACGQGSGENQPGKSLYTHGLEVISLMEEMATSEVYFNTYSGNSQLYEIASVVGQGDYTQPKAVYQIRIADSMLSAMGIDSAEGLSEALKGYTASRAQTALVSQINAAGGAEMLAAATICTAGKTFVSEELTGNALYLYTYENAVPAIVSFTPGEDNTVSATGSFIFYQEFKTETVQDIEQFFAETGATVEKIQ